MSRRRYLRPQTKRRRKSRRQRRFKGSVALGVIFLALVGINVYVFLVRGGTSVRDLLKTSAIQATANDAVERTASKAETDPSSSGPPAVVAVSGSMRGQAGLSTALLAAHLSAEEADALIEVLRPLLDLRALRPEQTFEIRLDPTRGHLLGFIYHLSQLLRIEVTRDIEGHLKARRDETIPQARIETVGGRITSSLGGALEAAGERPTLTAQFAALFNWDINWYTDPRSGDEFRIVLEKAYLGETFHGYGRILAASYRGEAGHFQAFYHQTRKGRGGYYTVGGRSVERMLLKTPLNYLRISSRYNLRRKHPVLHQTRGHYGVDFAAPRGTPVWAAASGTVEAAQRSGGAGNMIVLRHPQGVQTLYLHLHRFASGVRARRSVKQGQVIGYVGSTGLSTGPHLHYGIKVNGRHVDPLRYQPGRGALLSATERQRFLAQMPKRKRQLEAVGVADIAG